MRLVLQARPARTNIHLSVSLACMCLDGLWDLLMKRHYSMVTCEFGHHLSPCSTQARHYVALVRVLQCAWVEWVSEWVSENLHVSAASTNCVNRVAPGAGGLARKASCTLFNNKRTRRLLTLEQSGRDSRCTCTCAWTTSTCVVCALLAYVCFVAGLALRTEATRHRPPVARAPSALSALAEPHFVIYRHWAARGCGAGSTHTIRLVLQ